MPQSRLGSSCIAKRSKRCRERVTPYRKEQGGTRSVKETVETPLCPSDYRPTSNQLEVIKCKTYVAEGLISSTWHLYHASPLWLFNTDSPSLRKYSQQLTRQLQGQLTTASSASMRALQYMTRISSLPGFGLDGSEAIEIRIRQRQSRRDSPEFVAVMCNVNPGTTLVAPSKGFTPFPLLLVRGSAQLTQITLQWLQSTFDCHITPFKLTQEDLSILVSEYATATTTTRGTRGVGNVELVYSLPESIRKAGLSTISIQLPQDSAAILWEATSQRGEENDRRKVFVKKLSEHIHSHFHLKLETMTMSRISTPVLHADNNGRLKFSSPLCVLPVLSILQSYTT